MQKDIGFLENMYLNNNPSPLLPEVIGKIREEKVFSLVKKVRDAMGEYSMAELEKKGTIPPELLKALGTTGIFGLTIPEKHGGLGMTLTEYLKVIELLSRDDLSLVLTPLAHLSIGMKGILLFGSDSQKEHYLPKAASGEMIFAYALTEPKRGSDAQHVETEAELSEDGSFYLLNGTKTYITNGNYAGGYTVFAQMDKENPGFMGAFIVEAGWEGVTVGKDMPKMGLKYSSTTMLQFKDVKVPKENLIGDPGEGFKIAMTILNYGRLGLGAASAGIMQVSQEDMQKQAAKRTQFGKTIDSYELIQEKIVHANAHGFASKAITYFTAALLEESPLLNVAMESSHTKLYGTTRGWNSLYDAMQTAGGSGYLATQPYEKRMRDFRVTTIFEGTTEIHSIYPALMIIRALSKEIKGKGALSSLFYLWRSKFGSVIEKLPAKHPVVKDALKTAGELEKRVKAMIAESMIKYKKKVVDQEFLLRRITSLSLYAFILAAASLMLQQEGCPQEQVDTLAYLRREAKDQLQREGRAPDPYFLHLHKSLFARLKESSSE